MFGRLLFYLRYAARNLRRSARWTTFAVFCIAAGVATVVALRSLGLGIADSLTNNLRQVNHGDITVSAAFGGNRFFQGAANLEENEVFSERDVQIIEDWAAERDAQVSYYTTLSTTQVTPVDAVTVGRPQFVTMLLIDPQTFPPLGEDGQIRALEPSGAPLRDLFTRAEDGTTYNNDIVISRNLADAQSLSVGDTVRVSGTTEVFTVRGIVPTEAEASLNNIFASFFGFAYLPFDKAELLQQPTRPTTASIALPGIPTMDEVYNAEEEFNRLGIANSTTSTQELLAQNSVIADLLGRFIVIMGLGALLIGGVGIINTMLAMVGRRTNEIAALKTFGVKGRQVAAMFLSEAFLLGVMGSLVGVVAGVLLSGIVNGYGEAFLQQRIVWRFYPEAALFGLALGIVVTLVFGVLPVLAAVRVRPGIILRPNETVIPAAGCLQSGLTLLLVIVVIGAIAGNILGSIPIGIIAVAVTLLVLALLVGVMWVVVWIVSKFPAFGSVDLRLALRSLTARRIRTATTLLALSAGMFALSSITFVGAGTRELLNFQLTQNFGGNVIVVPLLGFVSENLSQGLLNAQLRLIEGIDYVTTVSTYNAQVERIDGVEPEAIGGLGGEFIEEAPRGVQRAFNGLSLQVRETTNPNPQPVNIIEGRALTAADAGQPVIVISDGFLTQGRGMGVGSEVEVRIRQQNYTFTVVGISSAGNSPFGASGTGGAELPPDVINGSASFSITVLQVSPENLNQVLLSLSANPTLIAIDVTFIDGLLTRFINQFSAIPTIVGLLSLLAAAVAMANTVSLAVLERRRQIGVLKAIGLKRRRVLGVLLLENTIIGVLGGVLGIGLSALGVALLTALGQGAAIPLPADARLTGLGLFIAAILIAWIATFLSAAPAASERVTSVLRYE